MNVVLPKKEKMNKKAVTLYIVAIVICVLAVIIVACSQYFGVEELDQMIAINTNKNQQEENEELLIVGFDELFKNKIERLEREGYSHEKAVKEAGTVVAVPGTSEHQLGLTLDFVTGSYKNLDEGIRNTKEYQWTEKHAWEYGYVIRYPKDKSAITGIISEPWHLRYVGIPAAQLMTEQDLCLEEFLGVAYDDQRDGISYGAGWINTGR